MSVNTVHLGPGQTLPLQHGEDVLTPGHTAEIELKIPATIAGPKRSERAKGMIWVTDHRVIFVFDTIDTPSTSASAAAAPSEPPSYDAPPVLRSLEIPYTSLNLATYNLPTFSANHLILLFVPDPSSSAINAASALPDPGRGQNLELKVWVGEGAGHAVWKRIEGERSRVAERAARGVDEELPAYAPA
ncbi:hypothetical protein I317_00116 [Kwoniella heveanensis CBS 569]|nr:hypothetical protein I317_00116 [Kwoniella heveanensis CBS 569]